MIKLIRNISVVLMSSMVFLLTIGATISQMHCEDNASLYFGNQESYCYEEKVDCSIEEISCCSEEIIEQSCCILLEDRCPRDSELLQFAFETTLSDQLELESCKEITLFYSISNNNFQQHASLDYFFLFKDYDPPPLLTNPVLSNLQSFLL